MQRTPLPAPSALDEIDLLGMIGILLDQKWLIAGITTAFILTGASYALLSAPVYRATSTIQIEQNKPAMGAFSEVQEMLGASSAATTEIQLLTARSVIGRVVDDLNLDIDIEPVQIPVVGNLVARLRPSQTAELAPPLLGMSRFSWGGEAIHIAKLEVPNSLMDVELTLVAGADEDFQLFDAKGELLVEGRAGKNTFENCGVRISVDYLRANANARFKIKKLHRLSTVIDYQDDLRVNEVGKESGIIHLSLDSTQPEKAVAILNAIGQVYVKQNIQRSSAEAASSLEFLRGQLPSIRHQLELTEDSLSNYQTRAKSADISLETKALLDQMVGLDSEISKLKLQQTELDRKYTRQHPASLALTKQIHELNIRQKSLTDRVSSLPTTQQDLLRLSREIEVSNTIYTQLLNKVQELEVIRAGAVGNVRIIDQAEVDTTRPVKPRVYLIITMSALLGLFIAVATILLRKALRRLIGSPEDIERLGLPVFSSVAHSQTKQGAAGTHSDKTKVSSLLAEWNPNELAIEALRSLRTCLHFAMLDAKDNRLMVSGPGPGVGKTFVSSNLAAVIAQAGQKVLLIDADMRKGYLHETLGLKDSIGLSELISKSHGLDAAIQQSSVNNLSFIARGQTPSNPSELLMHENFSTLLEEISTQYDVVILDTPPILPVTDAVIIGRQVSTSLVVARHEQSSVKELELTLRRLKQNGIEVKGAILNSVKKRLTNRYEIGSYSYLLE